ncbi:MAG: hypothetical protein QXG39_09735 [Candidatus Aenigmatarchaeota archaeon]
MNKKIPLRVICGEEVKCGEVERRKIASLLFTTSPRNGRYPSFISLLIER